MYHEKFDPNYPLAISHLKFQHYRFSKIDIETAVLFEWFIVKTKSFKYQEFYYSAKRIRNETGVRRRKLERIVNEFKQLGIINTSVRGLPQVTYYKVNLERASSDEVIKKFYEDDYFKNVKRYLAYLYTQTPESQFGLKSRSKKSR